MWQIEVTVVFDHEGDVIDMFHKNVSNCGLHAELEWEETGSSPTNLEAPRGAFGMITLEFPHVIVKSVRIQWCREMRFNFWSQPLPGEWKEGFLWGRCVRHGGASPGFPLREGLDPEPWGLGSSGSPPSSQHGQNLSLSLGAVKPCLWYLSWPFLPDAGHSDGHCLLQGSQMGGTCVDVHLLPFFTSAFTPSLFERVGP